MTVANGVRLELVDWGGTGRPVLLLTGSGHTAHVYDEFAPSLTDCCRVYGLTRRGYGASSRPATGYDDQRLADDVAAAIREAKLDKPILIGHSMAGGELTTLARNHSELVSALIYLDALCDLEDDPPADPEWSALQKKLPPDFNPPPQCAPEDRSSFARFRDSVGCRFGFKFPESEMRNQFEELDGGAVGRPTAPDWLSRAIGKQQVYRRDYSNIKVPVLAMMEFPRVPDDYKPKTGRDREIVNQFVERGRVVVGRWTGKLQKHVPDAKLVDVPGGGHYLWLKKKDVVLQEIHKFIASIPR